MKALTMMLVGLLIAVTLSAQPTRMVNFYQGNFSSLKAKAQQEQKPFFILFHATWSTVSQDLLTETLTDASLVNYVEKHYIAYRVDADLGARGSSELIRVFDVIFYPTMILFSPDGEEQYRFTGLRDPNNLLGLFRQYRPATAVEETAAVEKAPAEAQPVFIPLPSNRPEKTAALDKEVPATVEPLAPAPLKTSATAATLPATTPAPINKPISEGTGLFVINLKQQSSEGYGLQLGLYTEYDNVLREVDRFNRSYKQDILVHITRYRGQPAFRIIMGPFDHQQDASRWLNTIEAQGDVGVLVNLKELAQP